MSKKSYIIQEREYFKDFTQSKLYVPDEKGGHKFLCYCLEDIGRPVNVKIQDETCIPEGSYKVKITYSPAFKTDLLVLFNTESDHSINRNGVRYTGVRVHGGNSVADTQGCIIVAKNTDNKGKVSNKATQEVMEEFKKLEKQGYEVIWLIVNKN